MSDLKLFPPIRLPGTRLLAKNTVNFIFVNLIPMLVPSAVN